MSDPNTSALFQTVLDAFIRHITAPLVARIDALEKRPDLFDEAAFDAAVMTAVRNQPAAVVDFLSEEIDRRISTPEFIEKVRDAVLADDAFDDAVVGVMGNRASDVVAELEDDIKELDASDIGDRVSEVIRRGSFSIDFSSF